MLDADRATLTIDRVPHRPAAAEELRAGGLAGRLARPLERGE